MSVNRILASGFFAFLMLALPATSQADFLDISLNLNLGSIFTPPPVAVAPPPIPVYIVPAPPADGLLWAPGHWLWSDAGYFWVPGTWVQPPVAGVLWTPGYWGWNNGTFAWHEGYWAPHMGFYGGVNYGGGYGGSGFTGGGWQNGSYVVNRSVTNVTNITNVTNVTNVTNITNASFNGGPGGSPATPTPQEQAVAHEKHLPPTADQVKNIKAASSNPQLRASANGGKPAVAATTKPGVFTGKDVVAAKSAGAQNPVAEKHNQAVLKNPSLAKGAAIPKPMGHEEQKPAPQEKAKLAAAPHAGVNNPASKEKPTPEANHTSKPEEKKESAPSHQAEHKPEEHKPEEHKPGEKEEHKEPGEHE